MKITIIGAGSAFTKDIMVDIFKIKNLNEGVIGLVDIIPERLEIAHQLVEKLSKEAGNNFQVISSVNRREVLADSDFIINQIEVAGLETVNAEFEIPLKYGVKQCIGDTLGPGGLFKTLRTLPTWFEIIKDIEELAPNCMILNYTNPMSAVTLATTKVTDIPVVGLCHSVQNTTEQLAEYLEIPFDELKWRAGGINHMSWITTLEHNGKDMYPVLINKIDNNPKLLEKDPVRFDTMKYFGAFVTESSGHFSEYVPYYRKNDEVINKYCGEGYNGGTGFYANNWPIWREENDQMIRDFLTNEEDNTLEGSNEYAAVIIDAVYNNDPKVIYGNVPNTGLISNLPQDGIVEVACLIDQNGINPTYFGELPEHLAALNRTNMAFFHLAVDSVIKKDKELAFRALAVDPLTAAVLSLKEIRNLFDELYEFEKEYLSF